MTSPVKKYQREIHKELRFFATWLPGDRVDPGDIGVLQDGSFHRTNRLADLGIEFDVEDAGSPQPLSYKSTAGTTTEVGAGADASAVSAEVKIEFSQKGAFLFEASGARKVRIANTGQVAKQVMSLYENDKWNENWYLVTEVYRADAVTVVVSDSKSAAITLSGAVADLPSLQGISSPEANLRVTHESGKLFHALGIKDSTPLYLCSKVKDPLIGEARLEPTTRGAAKRRTSQRQRSARAGGEVDLKRSPIDDLLNS